VPVPIPPLAVDINPVRRQRRASRGYTISGRPNVLRLYAMKFSAFTLSVVFPGLGQVLLGRYLKGILIFFSIIILLDLSLVILPIILLFPLGLPSGTLCSMFYALCFLIYLYNLWDISNIVYLRYRKRLQEKKKTILKQSIIYYLQNDLNSAKSELRKALKLDKDDVDTLYYLSRIERASGRTSKEKAILTKLSNLDLENKWT
jgi:tetratricopeptide (TPR) repeat protein